MHPSFRRGTGPLYHAIRSKLTCVLLYFLSWKEEEEEEQLQQQQQTKIQHYVVTVRGQVWSPPPPPPSQIRFHRHTPNVFLENECLFLTLVGCVATTGYYIRRDGKIYVCRYVIGILCYMYIYIYFLFTIVVVLVDSSTVPRIGNGGDGHPHQ
jgi:hypothetical protein